MSTTSDMPELIEAHKISLPASALSWLNILATWQNQTVPFCSIFINNQPLEDLVRPLKKGDLLGFLTIFYNELLINTEAEQDPTKQFETYQSLINQYEIPADILDSNRYIFQVWINNKNKVTENHRSLLLNERLRHKFLLFQLIQDKNHPLTGYLSFFDVLRSRFHSSGILMGWHKIVQHRLAENNFITPGFWYITFHLSSFENGKINLAESFSYGDHIEDNNTNIILPAIGYGEDKNKILDNTLQKHFLLHHMLSDVPDERMYQQALSDLKLNRATPLSDSNKKSLQYAALLEKHHLDIAISDINDGDHFNQHLDEQDHVHFRGHSQYVYLPCKTGLKGKCMIANITNYRTELSQALKQPHSIELILSEKTKLRKEKSSLSENDPIFNSLQEEINVASYLVDYLTKHLSASELIDAILKNKIFTSEKHPNKILNYLTAIIEKPSFPFSAKIPLLIRKKECLLANSDNSNKSLIPIQHSINILKGAQKYLNEEIKREDFQSIVSQNNQYTEGASHTKLVHFIDTVLLKERKQLIEKIDDFLLQKKGLLNDEEHHLLEQIQAYLHDNQSAKNVVYFIEQLPTPINSHLLPFILAASKLKPALLLSLFTEKLAISDKIMHETGAAEQEQLKMQYLILEDSKDFLNNEITKQNFLERMHSLNFSKETQISSIHALLNRVIEEKHLFIIERIQLQLEEPDLTESDKQLLNQACAYLKDTIKTEAFQMACMNHPVSAQKFSVLLNEVIEDKPMLHNDDM